MSSPRMRRWVIVGSVCLGLLAGLLLEPTSRLVLLGWMRGESLYRGRPTGYWHRDLSRCEELWSFLSQDYYLSGPEPTPIEEWLSWLLGSKQKAGVGGLGSEDFDRRFPVLGGDPAAVPVLVELLQYPDCKARREAAEGLRRIGPGAEEAVPALVEIAQTTPDYALYLCARWALSSIDPEGMKTFLLERPDLRPAPDLLP